MENQRVYSVLDTLKKVLQRLDEILQEPLDKHDYILDASIQRFEFCIELYWKMLKHVLAYKGIMTTLPKESLQPAYAAGWIDDESLWLQMMHDRNLTLHTYKHETAMLIYHRIKQYYPAMQETLSKLQAIISETS